MQALAFDLGGTYLRSALVKSGQLSRVTKRRLQDFNEVTGRSTIWNEIVRDMVSRERDTSYLLESTDPVVISFPGPIAGRRQIVHAPTVCGANTTFLDLASELEEATGRTVHLLNDISAAAWYLSKETNVDRFMVVTISSGIGSKIFDRRHSAGVLDEPVYAGEIGHIVVDDQPTALLCDCGARGHLGAIASGRGVERTARRRARECPEPFAKSCIYACFDGFRNTLTNEHHLVPAALLGDEWALAIIRECTRPLARTLLANVMAMGLEQIFVIGGFARALGEVYLKLLIELMIEMSQYDVIRKVLPSVIQPGYSHEEPCLIGCGAFLEFVERSS